MKIIYIKESKETCDIVKRIILKMKKFLNIIKIENDNIYYLPIFKDSKLSKYRIKRLYSKIYKLLERDETSCVVLSEYLNSNQLLKNYLYSENINILDGRYLFKNMSCEILEYIFKIKNKPIELRRSIFIN